MIWAIIAFVITQLILVGIGLAATLRRREDARDYLMASGDIHPWLMALASFSTNSSGFMFLGLIGETYSKGLSAMWLMVGWISGDYLAWQWIYRKLRNRSQEVMATSIPSFVSEAKPRAMTAVKILAAVVTVAFLGSYAAAQLLAGGKAVKVLFDWPIEVGALISIVLIVMYSFLGGLRSSIWTNTAQAVVMQFTILMLLVVALVQIGGFSELWSRLQELDPALVDWRPRDPRFGVGLFILSWIAAGVGVLGQPHLVTLTMSIRDSDSLRQARPLYFGWYIIFSAACILAGLCCRVLVPSTGDNFDNEGVLLQLSLNSLPPVWLGIVLTALFSATMSTADTQIICCSAAVSQDLFPQLGRDVNSARRVTAAIAATVLLVALNADKSVFRLVSMSWSALASALGPLVVLQSLRCPLSSLVGVGMSLSGLITTLVWRFWLGWSDDLYEVLPGMSAGFAVYGLSRVFARVVGTKSPESV